MPKFTEVENHIIEKYISDPELSDSLIDIRKVMEHIWTADARIIKNYTDHGEKHSVRIAGFVEKLLEINPNVKFSEQEVYLLLAGVYLHDIGMQCDVIKYPKIKKKAESLGAKFDIKFIAKTSNDYLTEQQDEIRENHQYLSAAWIDYLYEGNDPALSHLIQSIPDALVDDLIDICKFHSKLPINDCPDSFNHYPNDRKKMVAALLRFTDELDITSSRVDLKTVQIFTIKPDNSVYWWLHNYTNITFIDSNKIRVTVRLHPQDFELYGSFIRDNYITKFKTKNLPVLEVLVGQNIPVVIDYNSDVVEYNHAKKFPSEITDVFDKQIQKKTLRQETTVKKPQKKSDFSVIIDNYNYRVINAKTLSIAKEQKSVVKDLKVEPAKGESINALINWLQSSTFKVLVLGQFNSGKSTFVNALLGQSILPSGCMPTTGTLCAIKYADDTEKRIVLFPKPGIGRNGDDSSFEVPISNIQEELKKYVIIDHFGASDEARRYQKIELYYPISLCKNGVEIIDTVGLGEIESSSNMMLERLTYADAIIYCMPSTQIYTKADKDILALFRALKYKSILFVMTKYDIVKPSFELGEANEASFKEHVLRNLVQWTELGEQGIMFVDSLSALKGKLTKDKSLMEDSGICKIEKLLESFFIQGKSKAKLLDTLLSLNDLNRSTRKTITLRISIIQTNTKKLEKSCTEVELLLKDLKTRHQLIIQNVNVEINSISHEAYGMAWIYITELQHKINLWVNDYEIVEPVSVIPNKENLKLIFTEVTTYLKEKIEEDATEWIINTLSPTIESSVNTLKDSLDNRTYYFIESVKLLRVQISAIRNINDEEIIEREKICSFETNKSGSASGTKTKQATIACELAGRLIVGMLGLINPVTLFAAMTASIFVGGFSSREIIKSRIKTKAAKQISEEIEKNRMDICITFENNIKESLCELRNTLDSGLVREINDVSNEALNVFDEKKSIQTNLDSKLLILKSLESTNNAIEEKLNALLREAGNFH